MFERGRRANPLRAATVAVVATGCLVLVSGCSPLWSVPNDDPLWVKVSDQTLNFVWCGENTRRYASLQVRIEATGAEPSGLSSFVAGGVFDLKRGQRFSILQPPEGAAWQAGPRRGDGPCQRDFRLHRQQCEEPRRPTCGLRPRASRSEAGGLRLAGVEREVARGSMRHRYFAVGGGRVTGRCESRQDSHPHFITPNGGAHV